MQRTAADGSDLSTRAAAIHLLIQWDDRKRTPMEELLGTYLSDTHLAGSDRGFLTEICYGAVRHRNTLRALAEFFLSRPLKDTHRSLRAAIAVGLYQRIYLQTPPHAAVGETVAAWRTLDPIPGPREQTDGAAGLLNAVLRRACESITHLPEGEEPTEPLSCVRIARGWAKIDEFLLPKDHRAEALGIQYSHPTEMVRLWLERYDDATLRRLFDRDNETPPLYLALRRDRDPDAFLRMLRIAEIEAIQVEGKELPTFRVLTPTPIERIPGFASGDFWVQDITARRLVNLLPKRTGVSLLDLCSAPGGKLATILDRGGIAEAFACDVSEAKLRLIAENLQRLRLHGEPGQADVHVADIPRESERLRFNRKFDQILVDAPCSNTGVLNRRHEARWRFLPEEVRSLTRIQHALIEAGIRHLAPGGDLLYTTCSIEPAENADTIFEILGRHTDIHLVEQTEVLPGEGEGDGGYAALLRRDGW
ncbi:MAG: transcription antitermination factor NusB [Planctomycetota bacterium]